MFYRMCLLLIIVSFVFSQIPEEKGFAVDEMVNLALERNQTLESLQLSTKSSELSRLNYWADYLPNFYLSYGYSRDGSKTISDFVTSRDSDVYSLSGNVSWTLFSGGQRWLELRSLNTSVKSSRAALTEYEMELKYIVSSACYNVIYTKQSLFISRQNLSRSQDERDFINEKFELGLSSKLDLIKMDIDLANARLAVLQKENSLARAYRSLNTVLDLPADSVYNLIDNPEESTVIPSLEDFVSRAKSSSRWIQIEASWQKSVYSSQMAWSSFFPTVSATASYSYSSDEFPEDIEPLTDNSSQTFGINLSWYLLNGGKRLISLEQSKISRKSADLSYELSARNYFNDIRDSYSSLIEAQSSVALAQAQWESAKLSMELYEEEFRLGTVSVLDLLSTRLSYLESHNNMISAQQAFRTYHAKLLWLCQIQ